MKSEKYEKQKLIHIGEVKVYYPHHMYMTQNRLEALAELMQIMKKISGREVYSIRLASDFEDNSKLGACVLIYRKPTRQ